MERIPQYSRTSLTQLSLSQTTHKICRQNNCVLTPRGNGDENKITDNGQSLSVAATKCWSGDKRELENFACKDSHQLRTTKISTSGDILNESSSGNCKVFSNGHISDYLEKDKPDEYFEDFLLSEKVLSKFALLLGESSSLFFSLLIKNNWPLGFLLQFILQPRLSTPIVGCTPVKIYLNMWSFALNL